MLFTVLLACQIGPEVDEDIIQLHWRDGQTFHVAASHQQIATKSSVMPMSMMASSEEELVFETEVWTEELIWSYQVVHSNFYPEADDSLYDYSIGNSGRQVPLSVLKADLDPVLNEGSPQLNIDPVIYLIFQEHRNRLAGLVEFVSTDGERSSTSWKIGQRQLGHSSNPLSQTNLTYAPTLLAPFGARWSGGQLTMENGDVAVSEYVADGVADVIFESSMGGEMIAVRYEAGAPWPTWVDTPNFSSRLIDEDEISALRGFALSRADLPVGYDFRQGLQAAISLDSAMKIDNDTIDAGEFSAEVPEEYRPWAGHWWPLKTGELVFGYNDLMTLSGMIRPDVDPLLTEVDTLSKELREMRKEDDKASEKQEYKDKLKTLQEKKVEAREVLAEFVRTLQSGLDGGQMLIKDGRLEYPETNWSTPLSALSPIDKWALITYLEGDARNPFEAIKWELLNSYHPGGESWWGHCNGWAAAAILTNEPTEEIEVEIGEHKIPFTTADIKGLLTESHYSVESRFFGERYNDEDDDVSDLSPAHFHKLITVFLKEEQVPLVFDTDAKEAVWNFPAWKADVVIEQISSTPHEDAININTATVKELETLSTVNNQEAEKIVDYREDNGPFQDVEELKEILNRWDRYWIRNDITVNPKERELSVVAEVFFTTDSVDPDHVDSGSEPESMSETWEYTLKINEEGSIIGGEWKDEESHPDFAWIPVRNARYGQDSYSENPYISYDKMLDYFGADLDRR